MKTRLFLSSTFYDLQHIRDALRVDLTALGHDVLLSEFSSFPIAPELNTIENCRRNVREHSDVFVLIVGGRRGSLDPASGRPITNLEYDTAMASGLDIYVFVARTVLTLEGLWKRSPDANFSPDVDDPGVFEFLGRLRADGRWLFPFESGSDIRTALAEQLSILLADTLRLKRSGHLAVPVGFEGESPETKRLLRDRPRGWEFLLTEALLRSHLAPIELSYADLRRGALVRMAHREPGTEYLAWIQARFKDLRSFLGAITAIVNADFAIAWGPPGTPGDPEAVRRAVLRLEEICAAMIRWELEVRTVEAPPALMRLPDILRGTTEHFFDRLNAIPDRIHEILSDPDAAGEFVVKVTIDAPPNLAAFSAEIDRIKASVGQ